ncbi:MAG: Cyanophycinase [Chroococcopsis gigantea SAG 12.99]|jgi:cyanophycinase|nr:cyanophycinase [Chlorogloea purpurea SAG 13.99]MDV2998897.1 Cyanophycinase [Chroococcopsis gigantea SAG 12.99]
MDNNQGQLVIIGGAEDRTEDCVVLREFMRCAGGTKAKIAVFTAATSLPGEVGADYINIFERLGAEKIDVIDTERKEDADRAEHIEIIKEATGAFFTGGNQVRIIEALKGTELDRILHERYQNDGLAVGGTSAGAAMMPDVMIVEGESQTNPRADAVTMGAGMGFLPGVVIDQHFAQRGRLGRLLAALVQQPVVLGFGIDEDTAIIVHGEEVRVVGNGSVTVVDESEAIHNNLDEVLKDEAMAICGVKVHILPHGYRFNLKNRQPVVDRPAVAA